jgi:tetratricopeptide (TPR) repeat protein
MISLRESVPGAGRLQTCKATSVPHISPVGRTGNSLTDTTLHYLGGIVDGPAKRVPCKTRPDSRRGLLVAVIGLLLGSTPLVAQEREADAAWAQGRFDAARAGYQQVLATNPGNVRANLRMGVMLSWRGKLDSSLVFLARARALDPADPEIRLIEAQVMAWDKQYDAALSRYDSLLAQRPDLREASLGRARTLAWAGRLDQAQAVYLRLIAQDSTDRDALLGSAQVSAWKGDLLTAERDYRKVLARNSRDADARVGLGYVYLWQGREGAAGRQAQYALAIDSTNKGGRELKQQLRASGRSAVETSASWSNDSDDNTTYWQTASGSSSLGGGIGAFGSVNALQASDPVREATRVGGEAGLSVTRGRLQVTGAAGARRLNAEVAPSRTAATYRGRLAYRPDSRFGVSVGYSRLPFDEIASLIERQLDMELLEGGFDVRPASNLTIYGGGGALWLNDGNSRTSVAGGVTRKIQGGLLLGLFGRTLSYERRGIGYFSPDRFSVFEVNTGYSHESKRWVGSLSGGLGVQQIGKRGAAQSEWHVEGRFGPRWGSGNRIELFGLITNSAVSSTSGAFRYRSAGLTVRLGL